MSSRFSGRKRSRTGRSTRKSKQVVFKGRVRRWERKIVDVAGMRLPKWVYADDQNERGLVEEVKQFVRPSRRSLNQNQPLTRAMRSQFGIDVEQMVQMSEVEAKLANEDEVKPSSGVKIEDTEEPDTPSAKRVKTENDSQEPDTENMGALLAGTPEVHTPSAQHSPVPDHDDHDEGLEEEEEEEGGYD